MFPPLLLILVICIFYFIAQFVNFVDIFKETTFNFNFIIFPILYVFYLIYLPFSLYYFIISACSGFSWFYGERLCWSTHSIMPEINL